MHRSRTRQKPLPTPVLTTPEVPLRAPQVVTIQKAAVLTGVAEHTLRWYERIGLVPDVQRSSNGRRTYSAVNLRWIRILRSLRSTGMPVAVLKDFTERHRSGDAEQALRILRLHRAHLLVVWTQVHRSLHVLDVVEAGLREAAREAS